MDLQHSTCRSSPCGHFAKIDLLISWCLVDCQRVGKTVVTINLRQPRHVMSSAALSGA